MKILKLIKENSRYFAVFDEVPRITYEKIGLDYVGSYVDSDGAVLLSHFLAKSGFGGAFAGREIKLSMKDGRTHTIKDYWFDAGSYKNHGEFISIGAETLEGLQKCYVYYGLNISVKKFNEMVEEYFSRDKLYSYDEIRDWCRLQYKWYNVIVHGKKIPYMMNKYGHVVERETKKRVFSRHNICKEVNGINKLYVFFKLEYMNNGRLIKVEANYLEVLKETLPFSEEEIRQMCGLV